MATSHTPDRDAALANFIKAQCKSRLESDGCTKRTAVRLAINDAITTGLVIPGDLLPTETKLVEITGMSLGTVQAALLQLVNWGEISRKRGDGTRVRGLPGASEYTWHFRMLDRETGGSLRFSDVSVAIDTVMDEGPHAPFLGDAPSGFIRIRRRMRLSNGGEVRAEMFIREDAAPGLADVKPIELLNVNIRPLLERDYGLPALRVAHRVHVMGAQDVRASRIRNGMSGALYEVHAFVFGPQDQPVYFQRIISAIDDCDLEFLNGAGNPRTDRST